VILAFVEGLLVRTVTVQLASAGMPPRVAVSAVSLLRCLTRTVLAVKCMMAKCYLTLGLDSNSLKRRLGVETNNTRLEITGESGDGDKDGENV
jgi:hypothetical protein